MAVSYAGAMLDTSVWVAVLEGEPAAEELAAVQGDLVTLTSPIVLAELASLSARGRMQEMGAVAAVLDTARVEPLTPEDAVAGGELHGHLRRKGHSKVELGDCLIYATAARLGARLITCDSDLEGEPGVLLLAARKSQRPRIV